MRTVTIKCDGCDAEEKHALNKDPPKGWAAISIRLDGFVWWSMPRQPDTASGTYDLCQKCQAELLRNACPKAWKRIILAEAAE